MSQVAARLGGSKGTLYSYFESKQALFEALVTESCGRFSRSIFEVPGNPDLAGLLHSIALTYVTLICSDWATRMFQVVAAEAQRRPEIGKLFFDSGPSISIDRLSRHIETFVAAGELAVDDSREAAEVFMTLCRGSLHMRRMLGQAPDPDAATIARQAQKAVSQFIRLYGCPPA